MRVWEYHAVGEVGLGECGGENFSGEVAGFVGVAFTAASAAAEAEADVVFSENVCEALDFASVRNGEQDLIARASELLDFFQHTRNCAVEAGSGLGEEGGRVIIGGVGDAGMFDVSPGERGGFLPPVVWL